MGSIRFQFDEHVGDAIAAGLRRRGIDVATAHELGLRGVADRDVLAAAHSAGRVMVTNDADYRRLHEEGVPHAGIVYYPRQSRTIGQMVELLALVHGVMTPAEMAGRLERA